MPEKEVFFKELNSKNQQKNQENAKNELLLTTLKQKEHCINRHKAVIKLVNDLHSGKETFPNPNLEIIDNSPANETEVQRLIENSPILNSSKIADAETHSTNEKKWQWGKLETKAATVMAFCATTGGIAAPAFAQEQQINISSQFEITREQILSSGITTEDEVTKILCDPEGCPLPTTIQKALNCMGGGDFIKEDTSKDKSFEFKGKINEGPNGIIYIFGENATSEQISENVKKQLASKKEAIVFTNDNENFYIFTKNTDKPDGMFKDFNNINATTYDVKQVDSSGKEKDVTYFNKSIEQTGSTFSQRDLFPTYRQILWMPDGIYLCDFEKATFKYDPKTGWTELTEPKLFGTAQQRFERGLLKACLGKEIKCTVNQGGTKSLDKNTFIKNPLGLDINEIEDYLKTKTCFNPDGTRKYKTFTVLSLPNEKTGQQEPKIWLVTNKECGIDNNEFLIQSFERSFKRLEEIAPKSMFPNGFWETMTNKYGAQGIACNTIMQNLFVGQSREFKSIPSCTGESMIVYIKSQYLLANEKQLQKLIPNTYPSQEKAQEGFAGGLAYFILTELYGEFLDLSVSSDYSLPELTPKESTGIKSSEKTKNLFSLKFLEESIKESLTKPNGITPQEVLSLYGNLATNLNRYNLLNGRPLNQNEYEGYIKLKELSR